MAGLLFQAFFRVAGLGGGESGPGTSDLLLLVGPVPAAWPAQAGNGPPLPALAWLYRAQTGLGAGKRPLPEGPRKAACCSPVPALLQRPCQPSAPGLQKSVCKFTFSFYCVAFDCCCCAGGFCSLAFSGHATKGMAVTGIKNILWPSLYRNSAARR